MTREDIIRLVREAGMTVYEGEQDRVLFDDSILNALGRFAALVAAAEREACAKVCDEMNEERGWDVSAWECANAIRARGEQ